MLAIRRVLNSCIQTDFDQTDINESNKENSAVRKSWQNILYLYQYLLLFNKTDNYL